MGSMKRAIVAIAILAAIVPALLPVDASEETHGLDGYRPADASAPPVTQQNLLGSERFWPYRVSLTKPWQPDGRPKPLRKGDAGVLIRVESSGLARVDFGRDGQYLVPVAETDLLESANRIRMGELTKQAPNFVLAIAPRLFDSAADPPQRLPLDESMKARLFLCVFADPNGPHIAELAASLAPLNGQKGVMTILFPQGDHTDPQVYARLRELKWPVPFVLDFLTKSYTRTILGEKPALPAVVLQTREGRLLLESRWNPDLASDLKRAIDSAPGGPVGAKAINP